MFLPPDKTIVRWNIIRSYVNV